MDRRRTRTGVLIGLAPLALAQGDISSLPIREARWLAPDRLVEDLTRQPAECLAWPRGGEQRAAVAIGRTAFRAPLLLGGQAARAGLSCASCHRNGRGNPRFSFPGLSGHPGTADVTSSLMSSRRGDGTANPKPIPDLAGPAETRIVSRSVESPALATFIHGLVVEEFDGPEPSPAVLQGLVAYVRAIPPCAVDATQPVTLAGMLDDADAALDAARAAADGPTARFLVGAARSMLGAVDERYRLPGLERSRELLVEADRELADVQRDIDMRSAHVALAIDRWRSRLPQRARLLKAEEGRSLFSPAVLERTLAARPPPSAALRSAPRPRSSP